MQANIVLFIFISSALMVIGYGQLSKSLIISNQKKFNEIDLLIIWIFIYIYFFDYYFFL